MNIGFAVLGVYDAATPGIPEGAIANKGVEAAGKAVKSTGVDIVGTGHNKVLPRQSRVDPIYVEKYFNKIITGEKIEQIDIIQGKNNHLYIKDGHHRYVAYMKAGYKYEDIPKNVMVDKAYYYNAKNWKDVTYGDTLSDSVLWS